MTDKQIIIDSIDVSGCDFYDKNEKYCLNLKMDTTGFKNPSCFSGDFQECIQDSKTCPYTFCDNNPNCYYKQLKRKENECVNLKYEITCLNNKVQDLDDSLEIVARKLKASEQECETLASQLDFEVQKKECLEQECERLKNIINVAKNSKLDLKSFLVGEAVQNEYEEQLDQLKEQLEAYKMEAEEGKEINAELKAENDGLKESCKNTSTSLYAFMDNCSELRYKIRNLKNKYKKEITKQAKSILKLKQAIEKIKEMAYELTNEEYTDFIEGKQKQILQICDEVNDV